MVSSGGGGGNMTGGEYVFGCLDNLLRISVFFFPHTVFLFLLFRERHFTQN